MVPEQVKTAFVTQTTTTPGTLVAAPGAGMKIVVFAIYASGASAQAYSLTGNAGGSMSMVSDVTTGYVHHQSSVGIYECTANTALAVVGPAGGGTVTWCCRYAITPA